MNWKQLTSIHQLDSIREASSAPDMRAVAIFKHSTRCSISATALSRLERQWHFNESELPIYYLDLLQYRDISNRIAADFGIRHESPQLLVIKNGQCVYHAAHFGIDPKEVERQLS